MQKNTFDTELLPLLEAVQEQRVFPDGKTFVDCVALHSTDEIIAAFQSESKSDQFDLSFFVRKHFEIPVGVGADYKAEKDKPVQEHIHALWDVLTRQPDKERGSLLPLPFPYIVPGGRFGEIYYWDSYFTMLGLTADGRTAMVENMVNNFSYLIDMIGYIPNGNRTYYLGRSQPPFYSLMIRLLADIKGDDCITGYLLQLEKEYNFWMTGVNQQAGLCSLVSMPGGELLNRYWDENDTPRPEAWREDIELAKETAVPAKEMYRHLRAGAASGWDFSSRWFSDPRLFTTIHTTDIVPVDLNCLLYLLEELLADTYARNRHGKLAEKYRSLAESRKQAIQRYCWNESIGFFFDNDVEDGTQTNSYHLGAMFPLYAGIATQQQSERVAAILRERFLHAGGLTTTLEVTGQQWDAPNGWAPLQWISIKGLERYGHHELAKEIAERWIRINTEVFHRTGKLMEKYNVVDIHLEAGGGEYAGQDGFGWTNGVLLALIKQYGAADQELAGSSKRNP